MNGFNAISRSAIYHGLVRWFPELIPLFRQYYARAGSLYTVGKEGRRLAVDENGAPYSSAEGCTQGDPLGPFWFAIGYHTTLLEIQARFPEMTITCYLDDTYYIQEPRMAHAALVQGERLATDKCSVRSNRGKQEVYGGPAADLLWVPATVRGACLAPADEAKGYAGGRLRSIKVLGAFIGERADCAKRLRARVEEHLAPLVLAARLRDTQKHNVSLQCQLEILRFCANTSLVYFLRTMGPAATDEATYVHDKLITEAWHAIIGTASARQDERNRAERQAQLPVAMGGCAASLPCAGPCRRRRGSPTRRASARGR